MFDFAQTAGKIFQVTFIKRSTGKIRKMTARLGVRKHLKGGKKQYDDQSHGLLTVYEVGNGDGYKSIPLDAITEVVFAGKKYTVSG